MYGYVLCIYISTDHVDQIHKWDHPILLGETVDRINFKRCSICRRNKWVLVAFSKSSAFFPFKEHIIWQQSPKKIGHIILLKAILETLVYLFGGYCINYQTEFQDFGRTHVDWPPWFRSWLFQDFVGVRSSTCTFPCFTSIATWRDAPQWSSMLGSSASTTK